MNRPQHLAAIITLFIISYGASSVAQLSDHGEATRQITFTHERPPRSSKPRYENGFLVQFTRNLGSPSSPNLFIYATDGSNEVKAITVWPESSNYVIVTAASAGSDGLISVSGISIQNAKKVPFIESVDKNGKVLSFFSTGLYVPTEIVRVVDGSIWSVGGSYPTPQDTNANRQYENYDVLRHYSNSGMLLQHLVPRWPEPIDSVRSVQRGNQLALIPHDRHLTTEKQGDFLGPSYGPDFGFRPKAKLQHDVFFAESTRYLFVLDILNHKLFRWDNEAQSLKLWRINHASEELITSGFIVQRNGKLYASRYGKTTPPGGMAPDGFRSGLYELLLGKYGKAEWSAIVTKTTTLPEVPPLYTLLGVQDDDAVYSFGRSNQVIWAKLP